MLITGMAQPQILDLAHPDHGWQNAPPRALHGSPFRNHGCSVLLPDGTVALVAGSKTDADADGVLNAEIFNPATGQWSVGAAATVPRVYHNVALLLADGRVWTAGSNHDGAQGHSEHRVEVYSPDYLDRGPRPTVVAAPHQIRVPMGIPLPTTFEIETPDAMSIRSAALLRCGSVTHAFDADQRYVGLEIVTRGPAGLTVAAPPTTNIAPPGSYFLFVVNNHGVPSVGWPVRVEAIAWTPPNAVPGWFGHVTAGGDLATADISGTGRLDLVVFHVDNPDGENSGHYRIGWDLNAAGHPAGGWSGVKPVPGWFGWDTSGAGVAVADISGSGRPDLVVFHIDAPEGDNHGHYRIGWDLNAAGDPAGGWTGVKAVPGWFGWETGGGGVAVGDISGTGRPDLVVFHVDNPQGENSGHYRIGWDLNAAGDPTGGWTVVKPVPGWFGWDTQGAGVAIADISGTGRPDIIVFHVHAPEGENHGYYRIGWDLDVHGDPAGGWTAPIGIPGWFGWDTQGAGVDVAALSGLAKADDIIVFHVNAPEGDNVGHYRTLVT
ncbi:MAG: galactose oxidase-like domain-containing protein [Acidimicrobiales bacterium]